MAATTLHEECPTCDGVGWYVCDSNLCVRCGATGRVDSPAALARLAELEGFIRGFVTAVENGDFEQIGCTILLHAQMILAGRGGELR